MNLELSSACTSTAMWTPGGILVVTFSLAVALGECSGVRSLEACPPPIRARTMRLEDVNVMLASARLGLRNRLR